MRSRGTALNLNERVRHKRIVVASEGHIYDCLNRSLVMPWKRIG